MKKTISLLLAIVMCACAFSFTTVSSADYVTYNLKLTDNGDGTATVSVAVPAGISSGKIVVDVSDNLAYIDGSVTSGSIQGTVNPNYSRDGISGICVTFAVADDLAEGTVVLTAKYSIVDGGFVSAADVTAPLWNLSNGDEKLGTDAAGDVSVSFAPAYFTVKFYGLNGTILSESSVERGTAAVAPIVPEPEGYVFEGWDKEFNNILSDTIVNAVFKRLSYTVKFIGMNNYLVSEQTVYHGEAAVAPSAPAVVGYTFVQWDADYSSIKSDTTVNAVYEKKEYTVTFKGKDGVVIDTQTVKYGEAAVEPTAPDVTGYDFKGWDSEFNNITGNKEVNAVYEIKKLQVTFEADGGGVLDGNTFVVVDYGTAVSAVAHPTPVSDKGYKFVGWDITEGTVTSEMTIVGKFVVDYVLGDVNKDGYVDNVDAAKILRYDAGIIDFTDSEYMAGDVNLDGEVNNLDAAIILKYDAGIIDSLCE